MFFPVSIFQHPIEMLVCLAVLAVANLIIHWLDRTLRHHARGQAQFKVLLVLALLVLPLTARADSVQCGLNQNSIEESFPLRIPVRATDKLSIFDSAVYLQSNSVLPLLGDTSHLLAVNLWAAQLTANLGQPDSLFLSETMVLRAITLSVHQYSFRGVWFGDTYCDQSTCRLAWLQSMVATNDLARAELTPPELDFGDVPVGTTVGGLPALATPEPSTFSLASVAILCLAITAYRKRRCV